MKSAVIAEYRPFDASDPDVAALITMSQNDAWLGHAAAIALGPDYDHELYISFWVKGGPVGFALARLDIDGRYRPGPIYVAPGWRNMGIAGAFIESFFKERRGIAWTTPNNRKSIATLVKCGFYRSGVTENLDGFIYHQYLKD